MIFIGGIGPRAKKLEEHPRICPNCGLSRAYLMRMDDYLSLFFIPILRIRKGEPFIQCEQCGHATDEKGNVNAPGKELRVSTCAHCDSRLERDFRYCPYCGKPL